MLFSKRERKKQPGAKQDVKRRKTEPVLGKKGDFIKGGAVLFVRGRGQQKRTGKTPREGGEGAGSGLCKMTGF